MNLKKKHQDALQEMSEQIDQLSKMKSKIEKEKSNKNLLATLNDLGKKVEEGNMTLGDFESQKRRLAAENGDLLRVAGDINNNVNMMNKMKPSLLAALDEAKHNADAEARERQLMLGKFKNVEHELDGLKEQLDGESADREDVARQTNKAESEAAMWRQKYETDAVAKAEELEMTKMKLQARF